MYSTMSRATDHQKKGFCAMHTEKLPLARGNTKAGAYQGTLVSLALLCTLLLIAMSSCGSGNNQDSSTITATATTVSTNNKTTPIQVATTATTTAGKMYHVKIYFSRTQSGANSAPSSSSSAAIEHPVERVTTSNQTATFALEQLVKGPTAAEQQEGYYSQVQKSLSGPSNCNTSNGSGNSDFILTLNKRGNKNEPGTATVKFCRTLTSAGVGTDVAIRTEIEDTLKQFSTIQKAVILTKDGHCFGDESGSDHCLG